MPCADDRSRTRPSSSASSANDVVIELNAFVEATETSGPAWMNMPAPHCRAIAEPMTFTHPTTRPPLRCSSSTAARVSMVSPDWLTAT